ncbi:hypothetical protein PHLCEN_2v3321 [Hermanssonia centrifuga]|uniref:Xylanolytic transcriptional activator regulatory domain-containing protein n=1 Tax=Hermanssonia centrifuga TaxID=98765 RepID=A0A2R6QM73_9APHY|nr:hypothetical protein PHLCEN_2v3321 [Hermanssonia centrifuga]
MPILDENIHTPASVLGRCPFLFTVICAVSSRFYEEKPDMYTMAVHFAKTAAANSFLDGWKTVEMCQAYALMAAYMPAARRWDEDRTWFYSGIAFRLAIDLDLNRPPSVKPTDERSEREILNRLRTYVVCYIMDRCFCINLGKAFMVPEDELIRNVASQFYGWKYQHKADGYLVSLVELFRIMTRFAELANPAIEARSASNDWSSLKEHQETDLLTTHKVFAEELNAWKNTAMQRCAPEHASKDPDDCLRMALMHSVYQYCRLVTFSAGLQQVMKRGKLKEDEVFFTGCLHAGSAVVNCVIDRILPTGFIRYSPEHVFALSAFGTAILMKCLRPEFASKLDGRQEARIFDLIKRLLKSMDPEQLTTDDQVTPRRCYAKFLQQLLTSRMVEREQHRMASQPTMAQDQYFGEDHQEYIPDQVEQMHISPVLEQKTLQSMDPQLVNVPFTNPWDPTSNQTPNAMNALLGFSESEYMPTFMAFPDQTWFM